jgi:hypothetical protein
LDESSLHSEILPDISAEFALPATFEKHPQTSSAADSGEVQLQNAIPANARKLTLIRLNFFMALYLDGRNTLKIPANTPS